MKKTGTYLRDSRIAQRISIEDLSDATKIKIDFIKSIEAEDWDHLPEYAVVAGFVKNISNYLYLDTVQVMALLRRDYPPDKRTVSSKPAQPRRDVSRAVIPRLRFAFVVLVLVALVLVYLIRQYQVFSSPPELTVIAPIQDQVITTRDFTVRGKTASDAVLKVNNQSVVLDDDGNFKAEIEVNENLSEVVIKATSRAGKETVVTRKIKVAIEK